MNNLFKGCSSLIELPNISKWNTKSVKYLNSMFKDCSSLILIPDISKWNTKNVIELDNIFDGCNSLLNYPYIYKWNFNNMNNLDRTLYDYSSSLTKFSIQSSNNSLILNSTDNSVQNKRNNILYNNLKEEFNCFNNDSNNIEKLEYFNHFYD